MPKAFTGEKTGSNYIMCPGCKQLHQLDKRWTFNGDYEKPTFSPSLNCSWGPIPEGEKNAGVIERCHTFIKDGMIQFLGDCTHELVNQTVPLLDIPAYVDAYKDY